MLFELSCHLDDCVSLACSQERDLLMQHGSKISNPVWIPSCL